MKYSIFMYRDQSRNLGLFRPVPYLKEISISQNPEINQEAADKVLEQQPLLPSKEAFYKYIIPRLTHQVAEEHSQGDYQTFIYLFFHKQVACLGLYQRSASSGAIGEVYFNAIRLLEIAFACALNALTALPTFIYHQKKCFLTELSQ